MNLIKKILKQIVNYIDGLLILIAMILIDVTIYVAYGFVAGGIVTSISLVILAVLIDIGAFLNGRR